MTETRSSIVELIEKAAKWEEVAFSSRVLALVNFSLFLLKSFSANLLPAVFALLGIVTLANFMLKRYTEFDLSKASMYVSKEVTDSVSQFLEKIFNFVCASLLRIVAWESPNLSMGFAAFCLVSSCLLKYLSFPIVLWILVNAYMLKEPVRGWYANHLSRHAEPALRASFEFLNERSEPAKEFVRSAVRNRKRKE